MENPFTADKQPFSMTDLLAGIKSAEATVDIYPDTSIAMRVMDLMDQLTSSKSNDRPAQPRSIVEESPEIELRNELDKLRGQSVTLHIRALSNKELEAVKNHIVATHKIDKNLPDDAREQAQSERMEVIYANLISKAVTKVEDHINDTTANALSVEDVEGLRAFLPGFQWETIKETFDTAQGAVAGLQYALGDPTFRGDEPVGEGEHGVSGEPEGSEGE